jgi:hypothetical protein
MKRRKIAANSENGFTTINGSKDGTLVSGPKLDVPLSSNSRGNDERIPRAECALCRNLGGCILGFPASWHYKTTQPYPITGWKVTKMHSLTRPVKANCFKPPVTAYNTQGGRTIVRASMCGYVRSQQFPTGTEGGPSMVPQAGPKIPILGEPLLTLQRPQSSAIKAKARAGVVVCIWRGLSVGRSLVSRCIWN